MKRILVTLALVFAACDSSEDKPGQDRQHEILHHRTSGFWTSNRPAEHGAYKWRLLAVGAVLLTATGYLLVRLLRRASAERRAAPVSIPMAPRKSDDPPDIPSALP